jgi:hypothetical protein
MKKCTHIIRLLLSVYDPQIWAIIYVRVRVCVSILSGATVKQGCPRAGEEKMRPVHRKLIRT